VAREQRLVFGEVADVYDRVEISAVRHAAIHVEKPRRVIRAAQQRETHPRGVGRWQRLCPSNRRALRAGVERVVIRSAGLEIAGIDLHREIAF